MDAFCKLEERPKPWGHARTQLEHVAQNRRLTNRTTEENWVSHTSTLRAHRWSRESEPSLSIFPFRASSCTLFFNLFCHFSCLALARHRRRWGDVCSAITRVICVQYVGKRNPFSWLGHCIVGISVSWGSSEMLVMTQMVLVLMPGAHRGPHRQNKKMSRENNIWHLHLSFLFLPSQHLCFSMW